MTVLWLRAKNDTNGNPRRCYLIIDGDNNAIDCIDEGYRGDSGVSKKYSWYKGGCLPIEVQPAEYRAWIKQFKATS